MTIYDTDFNTNRRLLLKLAAATALAAPTLARAAWPERPIRLVVPSAAGGSPDVICRIVANDLAKLLANYDNKGLMALAAIHLKSSRMADFESWLTRVLRNNTVPSMGTAIRDSLPAIQPK